MKMRKIVAIMMAALLLCCVIPFAATAAETSATIDFTDKANRTAYSTEQQVWEQNGIIVTNDKGASTSNVGDYGGEGYPARFYKSSTVKIEYPGMTKIVIDCTGLDAKYVNGWADSVTTGTATVENNIVTIELAEASDAFVWETLTAQSRAYNITVYGAAEPEVPAEPVVSEADFDTIVTTNASGDSSYNKTFTTEAGWVTENSAIQTGGETVMNPQFPVIGADNSSKAVCMNGKVSAPGKISSPVLTGGINKLTINYTKMFTDTLLSATITITDVATGEVYTSTFSREEDKNTKYEIWTYEWVLESPIAGDFTIVIANDCPSQATGNKDRLTVLDVIWESNGGSVTPPVEPDEPETPVEPDEPETPDEPEVPAVSVVTAPEAGVAYKLGLDQTQKGAIYYFTGAMSGYYGATQTDLSLAVDMYVEIVDGGYKLYFNDANGAKQYIKLEQSGTHYNFTFGAEGSVFTLDADKNAFCAPAGDQICYMGTYGSYVTVGCLTSEKISDTDYIARLYAVGAGETPDTPDEPDTPVEPDVPSDPAADSKLTIAEVIALGSSKEHNTYTEGKYYVTGVISEVYNTQYGNMKLADDAGNILTIYGTFSADGSTRYDAMDVQPVAGDTVTIYGIVGQYNGTAQIKNGWIVEHTAAGGETPDEPSEPSEPDTPDEPEAPAVGVVTNPVAGVAYKFALEQTQKGALYYFTGAMSGYYGATETDVELAVDMYVEIVEGGYKLYFNDANGAKQYIKLEQSGTHYNFTFGAEGSVFTLDAEKNAFCAPAGDQICYMGTYGSYVTVGCLTSEKISDTDYIARLYAVETGSEPETPDEPGTDSPATGDNTTVYVTLAVVLMALAAAAAVVTSKKRA